MDKIIIVLALSLLFISVIIMNKIKAKYADDIIIEYEKNIKPKFIKYYWIGLIPLFIAVYFIMNDINDFTNYFWFLFSSMIIWDFVTILKLNKVIKSSSDPGEFAKMEILIILILIGKTLGILGLKVYLTSNL